MTRSNPRRAGELALTRGGGATLWGILTRPEDARSGPRDPAELVKEDVLRNIQQVLSTRRGRCMGHPDYGMPEVSDYFVSPRGMARLAREVKETIERWEPRVAPPIEVRVDREAPHGTEAHAGLPRASFLIRARLIAPYNELCTFRTVIAVDAPTQAES